MSDLDRTLFHGDIRLEDRLLRSPLDREETRLPVDLNPNSATTLIGRHLILRPLTEEFANYLFRTYGNEAFWFNYRMNENRRVTLAQLKAGLKRQEEYSLRQLRKQEWVICRKLDNKETPIGLAGLTDLNLLQSRAEYLVGIVEECHRKPGVGLEASLLLIDFAFNVLGLNKLVSYIYEENQQSQKNTLALGFSREGLLRKHFRNSASGTFYDVYQNGLLDSDLRVNNRLARLSTRMIGSDITKPTKASLVSGRGESVDVGKPDLHARFQLKY